MHGSYLLRTTSNRNSNLAPIHSKTLPEVNMTGQEVVGASQGAGGTTITVTASPPATPAATIKEGPRTDPPAASSEKRYTTKRLSRFYFGGLAASGAACFTHPLDLLKVHLQTQQAVEQRATSMVINIIRREGPLAMFNGLSASLCRQMSYSLTRFGMYDVIKQRLTADDPSRPLPFYQKALASAISGAVGGVVGTPADMMNVRMQNDIKLPLDKRRNYKHAFDGLWKVYKYEGVRSLFNGCSMAVTRGFLMTFGQVALYDQYKQMLLQTGYFKDNIITHFTASTMAGTCATALTQPVDVMKTRLMNAKQGEYKNALDCFLSVAKLGPMGFFKGFVPAFVRIGPLTILTFIFFEQLRLNFGKKVLVEDRN